MDNSTPSEKGPYYSSSLESLCGGKEDLSPFNLSINLCTISLSLHTLTLYSLLLALFCIRCSRKVTLLKPHPFYPHNDSFWIATGLHAIFLCTDLGSCTLQGLSMLRTVGPGISLLSLICATLFYTLLEAKGFSSVWLLTQILVYVIQGGLRGLSFIRQVTRDELTLKLDGLDVWIDFSLVCTSLSLITLLAHTIYTNGKKTDGSTVGVGFEGIEYLHHWSSLPNRLTFFWFTRILRKGYEAPLEDSDLGLLPPTETTEAQFARLESFLKEAKGSGEPLSLWYCMWKTLRSSMIIGGFFRLAADFAGFVAPLGIKTIVAYVDKSHSHSNNSYHGETIDLALEESLSGPLTIYEFFSNGYIMAITVLLSSLLQSTFSQCSTFLVNSEGIHIKVALQALIYKKALKLYPGGSGGGGGGDEDAAEGGLGSIANIMSEDTNNLMMFFWMAHFIWAIPLKLLILMGLLYSQLGLSALAGAALCILLMIPLQFLIARHMSGNSKQLMERCDERLSGVSEILQSIRLLKVYAWELLFASRVTKVRLKEEGNLDRDLLYRSIMTFLTHISSVLVTLVTFGLYPLIEEDRLEPPKVFAALALFNQLTVPLFIFPITVPVVIDALVSEQRILDFLLLPETSCLPSGGGGSGGPLHEGPQMDENEEQLEEQQIPLKTVPSSDSVFVLEDIHEEDLELEEEALLKEAQRGWVLRVEDADFGWEEPLLKQINVKIIKGRLTVLVGQTGSGKSTLVSAILGEIRQLKGHISWAKGGMKVAYASQKAWMLNGSVRENILFGRGFRPARYKRVVEACALQPDIEILPERDATEIGDKGISLSGGQKQRIAIARALYSNAPLVILDDPLSALDVEVAHHVLDKGIRKLLIRSGRTVILVTHHLPVLHHAHHIVAMEGGKIRIQGTLKEIKSKDPSLYKEWHELITQKEAELQRSLEAKTAKERWTLLKLVSKIGLQFRRQGPRRDREPSEEPFRKRKGTFSEYKNFSHDIFLPSDECHDELMTPLLRRRRAVSRASRVSASSGGNKVALQRMSSLQGEPSTGPGSSPAAALGGGTKFSRLSSMPTGDGSDAQSIPPPSPRRFRSEMSRVPPTPDTLFKRILSHRKRVSSSGSSAPELFASVPSISDISEEEGAEEEELLGCHGSNEEREYGTVPFSVYATYFRACGWGTSGFYLLFATAYEVTRVLTNLWLSRWSDTVSQEPDLARYESEMTFYFRVYVCLSLLTVAVSLVSNLLGQRAGGNSRHKLYANLMDRVVRCPISFFDSTPLGRILNRFSSDVAIVDRKLCISMQRFIQFVFLCASAIVVNGLVNPYFLLVAIPVLAIYYFIQRFYRYSSRELQRLQAISRGPILSHFHETLQGLSIIRAFRGQERFTQQMLIKMDVNNRADMFINVGNRWLSISLDYLGSVIVTLATVGAMLSSQLYPDLVTPSIVGLAINYTLLVPVYLNWVVKFLAEVEMFMNSVDRLDSYSALEIEDYQGQKETQQGQGQKDGQDQGSCIVLPQVPQRSWPFNGTVEWENVSISYSPEGIPTISELRLSIEAGQKVGFCGRSGCGKSTLLMSLFRVSNIRKGRILIDGVDIQTVPLLKLRSSIAIIPQENILFRGTIRFNLDPLGKSTDKQIWGALEMAQMKGHIQALPGQLDADISEESGGGSAFSAGQKQLLALARAILHKSKLVIMDEATSSVDVATERTLLDVVRHAFKDCTVLTIAHRLETIASGDRVIVLEAGRIVEDGVPARLMRQPLSHFATMMRHNPTTLSSSS